MYEYRKNRKSGTMKVSFKGIPFPQQALDNLGFYEFTEDGTSRKILSPGAKGEESK
jgi:hypothetical protein